MYQGKVKFYKSDSGYGFITPDQKGSDLFFHISGLAEREEPIKKDDIVTYDIEQGNRGPKAVNIQVKQAQEA